MAKYVCKDCGRIFTSDSADRIEHTFVEEIWGARVEQVEYEISCPECGSSSYKSYYGKLYDGCNIEEEEEE